MLTREQVSKEYDEVVNQLILLVQKNQQHTREYRALIRKEKELNRIGILLRETKPDSLGRADALHRLARVAAWHMDTKAKGEVPRYKYHK